MSIDTVTDQEHRLGRPTAAPNRWRRDDRPDRVVGLDVARALAVFGMLGAHVGAVASDVGLLPSSWLGVVNGRSSILFAVLAGISVALLSGRTVPVHGDDLVRARVRIFVRAAWVLVIGGALEALGTDIDIILGVYAVLFVLALPFLRWPRRRLLLAAGVLAVLTPPVDLVLAQFADANDAFDAPFVSLAVTGAYPALIWWTFILVGLAVGRCDLGCAAGPDAAGGGGRGLGPARLRRRLVDDAVVGRRAAAPGSGRLLPAPDQWDPVWLTGASAHSGTTFEIAGSVGVAFLVIAVCLVAADRLPRVLFALASVGSMALTAYVGTVVAGWVLGTLDYTTNWPWTVYVVATLVLATAWRLLFGRGPLERLLTWSSTGRGWRGGEERKAQVVTSQG